MKKILFILLTILLFSCENAVQEKIYIEPEIVEPGHTPKIAFSFDDQLIENWYPSLIYLKNKFPDFTATLFVCRPYTITDDEMVKYKHLYDLGFEIGAHNLNHDRSVSFIEEYGNKEFIDMQYEYIDFWKSHGIEVKSFAYPYGSNNEITDGILKDLFSVIRDIKNEWSITEDTQYVGAFPTDEWGNVEEQFLIILDENKDTNNIITTYGHNILSEDIGFTTTIECMESWIEYCIENKYEFINMKDVNEIEYQLISISLLLVFPLKFYIC